MSRRPTLSALALLTLPLIVACAGDDDSGGPRPGARLLPLANCGQAGDYIKQIIIAKMNKQIDERIASYCARRRLLPRRWLRRGRRWFAHGRRRQRQWKRK